jgi:hypothetical protein
MIGLLLVSAAGMNAYGGDDRASDDGTNLWKIQVGWVHQWGRGMRVSGPTPAISGVDLSRLIGRAILSGAPTPTYPDNNLLADRNFDDGYVRADYWTGDIGLLLGPNPERYGMTWNWGCDNASQYNYDGGGNPTLTYRLSGSEAVLGAPSMLQRQSGDDDLPTEGLSVRLSRRLYFWTNTTQDAENHGVVKANTNTTLDLALGLSWFPKMTQKIVRQATMNVYGITEVYTYLDYYGTGAGGSWPPLDVPYQGIYGDAYTAGPLIPERPVNWDYTQDLLGTARDRIVINSEIWRLRGELGVSLTRALSESLSVFIAPQFVLEFVDMRASRRETLTFTDAVSGDTTTTTSPARSKHKMSVVPGFLLTVGAEYLLDEDWFVGASLGWEWLAKDPSIRVGSSRLRFDLDGGELNLYLGRHF